MEGCDILDTLESDLLSGDAPDEIDLVSLDTCSSKTTEPDR